MRLSFEAEMSRITAAASEGSEEGAGLCRLFVAALLDRRELSEKFHVNESTRSIETNDSRLKRW